MDRANSVPTGTIVSKSFLLVLGAAVLTLQAGLAPCLAKRPTFNVPSYNKLNDGSGPETNDVSKQTPARTTSSGNNSIAPVRLDEGSASALPEDTSGGPMLKATVNATGFVPKGPVDPSSKSLFIAPTGIADKLGDNLKKAKQVNVMPLPLLMSDDEAEKKVETMIDSEKAELAELWESALGRSPDIQFVIQKLMPTSNPGHGSTILMRMLSTAVFAGMGAGQMMMPNAGGVAITSTTGNALMNMIGAQESKAAKNARLSQTEQIMLYNMVRTTADKLVDYFRNYKKTMAAMQKANTDLQDLQAMVSEARSGQDASKQLEMEYTLRRQQRDVDGVIEDLRRYRQGLVDLSGPEAVAKLDQQIQDEQSKIEQATPAGTPNPSPQGGESVPSPQTAGNPPARG